jgi:hypothetical protein
MVGDLAEVIGDDHSGRELLQLVVVHLSDDGDVRRRRTRLVSSGQ